MQQYSSRTENYSSNMMRGTSPSKWTQTKEQQNKGYSYKTSYHHQYNSSSGAVSGGGPNTFITDTASARKLPMDKNIDQLDALLEDLKNERQVTNRERDGHHQSLSYRTIERSSNEEPMGGGGTGNISRSTRILRTSHDGHPSSGTGGGYLDTCDSGYLSHSKNLTSSSTSSSNFHEARRMQLYESNRSLNRTAGSSNLADSANTTTTITTQQMEKDLENLTLRDDILPVPGTKVTTTVRTYTYEIPTTGPGSSTTSTLTPCNSSTLNRKNMMYNETMNTNSTMMVPPIVPSTATYNSEMYSTIHKGHERPVIQNQSYEIREQQQHYEQHNNSHLNEQRLNYPLYSPTNNLRQPSPTRQTTHYIYKETATNNSNNLYNNMPGTPGVGRPGPRMMPGPGPDYSSQHHLPQPTVTTYNYSSTTRSTRPGPDYGSGPTPSMPPAPFPLDAGGEYPPINNGQPPQRVEDLMQSLGNTATTTVTTTDAVDRNCNLNTPRKKEIETAVASPKQQSQIIPSVNRPGKEVYYPPGHDMMITKRECASSGSAAGGRWAKASGSYEYESGSKMKTKSKSGATMVPVCLPLCCAMPCSIM